MPGKFGGVSYRERLIVPVWWWLFGAFVVVSLIVAVWAYMGEAWAIGMAIVASLAAGALLIGWGSAVVSVDSEGIRVGRANIDWVYVADVVPLDRQATQNQLGVASDPRGWFFTRPYIATAIRVDLDDPADPHPFWLVSTRQPNNLVDATIPYLERT